MKKYKKLWERKKKRKKKKKLKKKIPIILPPSLNLINQNKIQKLKKGRRML